MPCRNKGKKKKLNIRLLLPVVGLILLFSSIALAESVLVNETSINYSAPLKDIPAYGIKVTGTSPKINCFNYNNCYYIFKVKNDSLTDIEDLYVRPYFSSQPANFSVVELVSSTVTVKEKYCSSYAIVESSDKNGNISVCKTWGLKDVNKKVTVESPVNNIRYESSKILDGRKYFLKGSTSSTLNAFEDRIFKISFSPKTSSGQLVLVADNGLLNGFSGSLDPWWAAGWVVQESDNFNGADGTDINGLGKWATTAEGVNGGIGSFKIDTNKGKVDSGIGSITAYTAFETVSHSTDTDKNWQWRIIRDENSETLATTIRIVPGDKNDSFNRYFGFDDNEFGVQSYNFVAPTDSGLFVKNKRVSDLSPTAGQVVTFRLGRVGDSNKYFIEVFYDNVSIYNDYNYFDINSWKMALGAGTNSGNTYLTVDDFNVAKFTSDIFDANITFNIKDLNTGNDLNVWNMDCNDNIYDLNNQNTPLVLDMNKGVYSCIFGKVGYDLNTQIINADSNKSLTIFLQKSVLDANITFTVKDLNTNNDLNFWNIDCNVNAYDAINQITPTTIDFNKGHYSCVFSKLNYDNNSQSIIADYNKAITVYLQQTTIPDANITINVFDLNTDLAITLWNIDVNVNAYDLNGQNNPTTIDFNKGVYLTIFGKVGYDLNYLTLDADTNKDFNVFLQKSVLDANLTITVKDINSGFDLNNWDADCNVNAYDQVNKNSPYTIDFNKGVYSCIFKKVGYDWNTVNVVADYNKAVTIYLLAPDANVTLTLKDLNTGVNLNNWNLDCNDNTYDLVNQNSPKVQQFKKAMYSGLFSKSGYDSNTVDINAQATQSQTIYLQQIIIDANITITVKDLNSGNNLNDWDVDSNVNAYDYNGLNTPSIIDFNKGVYSIIFGKVGYDMNTQIINADTNKAITVYLEKSVLDANITVTIKDMNTLADLNGWNMDCNVNYYDLINQNTPKIIDFNKGHYSCTFQRNNYDTNTQLIIADYNKPLLVYLFPRTTDANFVFSYYNDRNYLDQENGLTTVIIDFNDLSRPGTPPMSDWNWYSNEILFSHDQNARNTYTVGGDYNTTLIAIDSTGLDGNITKLIKVFQTVQNLMFDLNYASITSTSTSVSFDLNANYDGNAEGWWWLRDGSYIGSGSTGIHLTETTAADKNYCIIVDSNFIDVNKMYCKTFAVTKSILINEENGMLLDSSDFNGDAPKHIKKVIVYDINGGYLFDFNSNDTNTAFFVSEPIAYNFEITYNNAGLEVKYKKEIDFSLLNVSTARICIAPLQTFYEQIFTSVKERQIIVYLPTADCYTLAATLRNIYQQGLFNNVFTINKTYQAYTYSNGLKTFLAWINGGSEYSHNLDAIEFNQQAIEIEVGQDTLAFVPLLNTITGAYDTNTLQIYFKSYYQNYVSTDVKIYFGNTLVYNLVESTTPNDFVINWNWTAYPIDDENVFKIVVTGTDSDGKTTTLTEYFNIYGQSVSSKDPTFIAIMVILFFLFGITITTVGRTFGWIGLIICVISMAISLMALPGLYWISMIQAGIFICFLYILLNGSMGGKNKGGFG